MSSEGLLWELAPWREQQILKVLDIARMGLHGLYLFVQHITQTLDRIEIWGIWRPSQLFVFPQITSRPPFFISLWSSSDAQLPIAVGRGQHGQPNWSAATQSFFPSALVLTFVAVWAPVAPHGAAFVRLGCLWPSCLHTNFPFLDHFWYWPP